MQPAPDFSKQAIGTIARVTAKADGLRNGVNRAAHETRPTLTQLAQKVKSNPEFAKRIRLLAQRHAKLMNDISTANSTPVAQQMQVSAKPMTAPHREVAAPIVTTGPSQTTSATSPRWVRMPKPKGFNGPN